MKNIDDKSINLIVIDPPYNIGKDTWDKIDNYIEWMGLVFKECERVLKNNGSFYWFHNDMLKIAELMMWLKVNSEFVFKSLITWNKENFKRYAWNNRNPDKCRDRNWFPNVEYCLYYTFQDETGLTTILKQNGFYGLQKYFKEERLKLGWNYKQCDDYMGIKASYCYWDKPTTHPYRIPEEKHYLKLQTTGYFPMKYESLRMKYESLRMEYESLRYVFNLREIQENTSCVWKSKESNSGKLHPTQKPIDIINKIIITSSNPNDIVLDCFLGSGTTAIACINTNRNYIGIEKEEKYFNIANDRINQLTIKNT